MFRFWTICQKKGGGVNCTKAKNILIRIILPILSSSTTVILCQKPNLCQIFNNNPNSDLYQARILCPCLSKLVSVGPLRSYPAVLSEAIYCLCYIVLFSVAILDNNKSYGSYICHVEMDTHCKGFHNIHWWCYNFTALNLISTNVAR